ncbi:multicopper oxidase domain-containing protein [Maribacter ulvicola]|uniref:Cell division protein SufI n=1 Tax=Maribacter ulvicola TaxID=228959 RepID=A0A1N6QSZ1_9FLAO|nr:multicopper oxidase domain-containing protein [Maribacter ulvicola]SIQ19713.1 cell division protein SufI [Maribacter ulvicola]
MKHSILIFLTLLIYSCANTTKVATNKLNIPHLLDSRKISKEIELKIQYGNHQFFSGIKSNTMGFNGNYLGPTIKLYRGDSTKLKFTNDIEEPTTVHGHGLHVNGEIDGGPQNIIKPNEKWEITIPVQQEASTNWYHPHLMGKTAEHVHAGLAGLYIIEDENSIQLPLPKTYGVNDIPLVVQDRGFTNGKMNDYSVSMQELMEGKREETLVINGTINPFIKAPKGWLRLRILNGSNARFYELYLKGNLSFYKIATEGGFLDKPIKITELKMAPGERNEIMIDLSDGLSKELMATFLPAENDGVSMFLTKQRVLDIRVDNSKESKGTLPEKLNQITPLNPSDAVVTRTFELEMDMDGEEGENMNGMDMGNMFSINGKSMDMMRIDEKVKKGEIEIWRIKGEMMEHPFHMHGTSFLILSQNGNPPKKEDQGWKDVVIVGNEWTEVIMKFNHVATKRYPYMYHCHILEHEDAGMMGQFTVE